jgi:ketosteroid isomerase-like protein
LHKMPGMKKLLLAITFASCINTLPAQQLPCSNPVYRQFDFWIGEWEAFGTDGLKAGNSKVTVILDSCIILEEWTSATVQRGLRYAGKSFNTYNASSKQWQQTWVDNAGGSNEYLLGKFINNQIIYSSTPFKFSKDTMAIRKMTFTNLGSGKLRQHGEISKDNGISWSTEYDLEYRRKTSTATAIADTILRGMEEGYNTNQPHKIAGYYAANGKVIGKNVEITGSENMLRYWKQLTALGGTWKLTNEKAERSGEQVWQKGVSVITDKNGKQHTVNFTLVIIKEDGQWKILQDAYW